MNNFQREHNRYLERLVGNLGLVGEDTRDISWIMREGIWLREDRSYRPFPDLIVVHRPSQTEDYGVPIELKRSGMRHHAMEQLKEGETFIKEVLGFDCPAMKYVQYETGEFKFETWKK